MDDSNKYELNPYEVPGNFFDSYKEFIRGNEPMGEGSLQQMWLDIFKSYSDGASLDEVRAMAEVAFSVQSIGMDELDTDMWRAVHDYAGQLKVADAAEEIDSLIEKIRTEMMRT